MKMSGYIRGTHKCCTFECENVAEPNRGHCGQCQGVCDVCGRSSIGGETCNYCRRMPLATCQVINCTRKTRSDKMKGVCPSCFESYRLTCWITVAQKCSHLDSSVDIENDLFLIRIPFVQMYSFGKKLDFPENKILIKVSGYCKACWRASWFVTWWLVGLGFPRDIIAIILRLINLSPSIQQLK